jgi:hypothetical protein
MKKEMIIFATIALLFSLMFSLDPQFVTNAKSYAKQVKIQETLINGSW